MKQIQFNKGDHPCNFQWLAFLQPVIFLVLLLAVQFTSAQSIEFHAGGSSTTATGPTTTSQVITFQENTNNPSGNTVVTYTPTTTATFSLSNQQYAMAQSPSVGLSFGATITQGTGNNATANAIYPLTNSISTPTNTMYTSVNPGTAGTGIDITANRAVALFASARPLYNTSAPVSGRYYFGDLTITFNRGLDNPIIHVTGMGGFYASSLGGQLGFSVEYELQTSGITLSKLSGTSNLSITSTKILNSASTLNSTSASGAATGSVLATGTGITTLTFKVYVRSDASISTWGENNYHTGDLSLMAISLTKPPVCTNPTITTQPTATTACTGNTMTVAATGSGLTYQWESSSDGVTSGGNAGEPGNTTNTLDVSSGAAGYYFRVKVSEGSCFTYSNWALLSACPPTCTAPSAITLTQTAPTCTGATANNNGKITLSASTNGTHYGVSTVGAASYDGAAYASATAISGTPDVKTGILNTGGTYIIRIFNGSNTCYTDQTVTVAAVTCSVPCPSPNCGTGTIVKN